MEYYDKDPTGKIPPIEPPKSETDLAALDALDNAATHPSPPPTPPQAEPEGDTKQFAIPKTRRQKRARENKMRRGVLATIIVAAALLLVAGGAVLLAQPWVPAPDDGYVAPTPTPVLDPVQIAVGETAPIRVDLGDNERIDTVTTPDNDVIRIEGDGVTGVGEWSGAVVTVQTCEIQPPAAQPIPFKVLGIDLTAPYNAARGWLRQVFGIEQAPTDSGQPRPLNIYEITVDVIGYPTTASDTPINLYNLDQHTLRMPELRDDEEVRFAYNEDRLSVDADPAETGVFYLRSGVILGTDTVTATVGFYKDGIFVPMRAVTYAVEIAMRPAEGEEAVFENGAYNGEIPVLETPA